MIDFERAATEAFEWIQQFENVSKLKLATAQKSELGIGEVWRVETEISLEEGAVGIEFDLLIPTNFPLKLPRVYLSPASFERFKFLPHTQADRYVCTFSDEAQPNLNFPGPIIEEVLKRAKRIIEDGATGRNHQDYQDEYNAYWSQEFSSKDKNVNTVLTLLEGNLSEDFTLLVFKKKLIGRFEFLIHRNEFQAERFKEFLKEHDVDFNEVSGLYLGDIDKLNSPPFTLRCKESIDLVSELDNTKYKLLIRLLNKSTFPKAVLFSKHINGTRLFFGWFYPTAVLNRNGFRAGSITGLDAFTKFQANEYVTRFEVEDISLQRLIRRTTGQKEQILYKNFTIVGIGSVGSHLTSLLYSIPQASFSLVDDDILKIENTGRHVLGFSYVGHAKVKAMKEYLTQKRPTLNIDARQVSVIDIIRNDLDFINKSNFLFICIGNLVVEKWIASLVKDKKIMVPVFFLWVEPHLLGGHLIVTLPGSNQFAQYFTENDSFKFNVISSESYKNLSDQLSLRESGCQTIYTPYAGSDMPLFISAIFPIIIDVIQGKRLSDVCYTWVGNLEIAATSKIETVSRYDGSVYGQLYENKL